MKFTTLLLGVAACAFAEPEPTKSINSVSALEILASALPQSLVNLALTNPAAASSVISSEFAHSETPAWYSKLPPAVQTYLVPITTISQAPSAIASGLPTQLTSLATLSFSPIHKPMNVSANMTITRTISTKTNSKTTTKHTTPQSLPMTPTTSRTSSHSGGASVPTAVFGAGIAGVVGVVGLLAL